MGSPAEGQINAAPATYFDAASTEPLHPVARATLLAALDDGWADPARLYRDGRRARMRLDAAREIVAEALGAAPAEVSFTSSGTQALQLGMLGCLKGRARVGTHLVTAAVEHSAVLHLASAHAGAGGTVDLVGVDRVGRVDPAAFAAALRADTALACLQSANHEVGTLQPVAEVAALSADSVTGNAVPLLVDAAQSPGRVPVPAGWSVLTASAHKWGGPPGVGVLAVKREARWRSPLPPGEREGGRAPGFENVPAIAAAAAALAAVTADAKAEAARLAGLTERIRAVASALPDVVVHGPADPAARLPHLVTFSCLYLDGESLVRELDRAGFAVNSGSSCTADTLAPSHVLEAMGVLSHGNVRVSLPRGTAEVDVERFLVVLPRVIAGLREAAGVSGL
ncbi:MAG TPA: aminotransferase class V-fold PLP-dependent enzyme [Sporichthya sp.]|nr:aminotransferase class V-fold PLP-dependent enzyme [Sporichthya sp.]